MSHLLCKSQVAFVLLYCLVDSELVEEFVLAGLCERGALVLLFDLLLDRPVSAGVGGQHVALGGGLGHVDLSICARFNKILVLDLWANHAFLQCSFD